MEQIGGWIWNMDGRVQGEVGVWRGSCSFALWHTAGDESVFLGLSQAAGPLGRCT